MKPVTIHRFAEDPSNRRDDMRFIYQPNPTGHPPQIQSFRPAKHVSSKFQQRQHHTFLLKCRLGLIRACVGGASCLMKTMLFRHAVSRDVQLMLPSCAMVSSCTNARRSRNHTRSGLCKLHIPKISFALALVPRHHGERLDRQTAPLLDFDYEKSIVAEKPNGVLLCALHALCYDCVGFAV